MAHSTAWGIVLKLFPAGLIRRCVKTPGWSGFEPTELAVDRVRGMPQRFLGSASPGVVGVSVTSAAWSFLGSVGPGGVGVRVSGVAPRCLGSASPGVVGVCATGVQLKPGHGRHCATDTSHGRLYFSCPGARMRFTSGSGSICHARQRSTVVQQRQARRPADAPPRRRRRRAGGRGGEGPRSVHNGGRPERGRRHLVRQATAKMRPRPTRTHATPGGSPPATSTACSLPSTSTVGWA